MAIQPTQVNPTTQQSDRGYIIDHIVLHHAATTSFDQVVSMMVAGTRQVSSNYVVKDDRIAAVVPENMRSWSLSSALWDGRSVTFEICNEYAGEPWPVSAASHETVARMAADICGRYGIPINRDRILGHREVYSRHGASYATACPGGLNMDWIVTRAQQIATGAPLEPEIESENTDMTDIIYYAASGSPATAAGITIEPGSMWYTEAPGCPVFPLTDGKDYLKSPVGNLERSAFDAVRGEGTKDTEHWRQAKRFVCSTADVKLLIEKRGLTNKPIGNFGGSGGGVNLPDPVAWGTAAAAAFASGLPTFAAAGEFK